MRLRNFAVSMSLAAITAMSATATLAQDWKSDYRIVRFGLLSGENQKDAITRYEPLRAYLSKELGVEVELFTASNYDGSIQALAANQIEFTILGSSGYAAAYTATNGGVEPLVVSQGPEGDTGYYSVIVTKCDSPYKTIEDLKGKTVAFADPDSTSGYNVPYYNLREQGFDPATFFGAIPFSGSHEAGVMGVNSGQFDAAATHRNNEEDGVVTRMEGKNMIEKGNICTIWQSPEITNSPVTARSNLPAELIDAVRNAYLEMDQKAPEVMKAFAPGAARYVRTSHETYQWIVDMREWFKRERRR